jgi:phenylalanyl-tRNA synthetase beta chain
MAQNWRTKRRIDFFDIKGIVGTLLLKLGVQDATFVKGNIPFLSSGESASIKMGEAVVGIIGKLKADILSRCDIGQDVYIAELDIESLISLIDLKKTFRPIPKFPSVKRDVSILLDRDIPAGTIIDAIHKAGIPSIVSVDIFDEYHGKQIPQDKKSLSFSILYRDRSKTLTDSEVEASHSKVKDLLTQQFSAQFR